MKSLVAIAILSLGLCGCVGPEGNPNGYPYANQPGGALAVPASDPVGQVSYDPNAAQPMFEDMRVGGTNNKPPTAPPPAPRTR